MRQPRLKPLETPMFYHLYNRVAGEPGFLPFGPREKEQFVRILHKLDLFFTIRVVAYQVMSNHFHLVVQAPEQAPTAEEVCRGYAAYHGGKRTLEPTDPQVPVFAARMRDISWYMHALQQQFSTWYNRTRSARRRGGLWAQRFKHTLLGDATAVWECCKYLELNPVRAGMVQDPADYRFCSYGTWCGKGRHPFEENVQRVLLPYVSGVYGFAKLEQLRAALRDAFAGLRPAAEEPPGRLFQFRLQADRRVRYWVDGLLIGSELFIRDMINRHGYILRARKRGLTRAQAPDAAQPLLCCYKQLRAL